MATLPGVIIISSILMRAPGFARMPLIFFIDSLSFDSSKSPVTVEFKVRLTLKKNTPGIFSMVMLLP